MSVEKVVERYFRLVMTEHFAKYSKDFAYRIQRGLNEGYNRGLYEPALVSVVEKIINNLNGISTRSNRFEISTKSIFIHGIRSIVEFEYYGQKVQRELGDLFFILSVIYNGKKYFEKFTISQFKKENGILKWNISNKEQVYLLSRFPSFRGVRSSKIPAREFNLPNISGCLGSFILLYEPGDFIFISASQLELSMRNRKSIDIINIFKFLKPLCCYICHTPFDRYHIEEFFCILCKVWRHSLPIPLCPHCFIGILGFSPCAYNVHDFVDKYLRGCIGEIIYLDKFFCNQQAFNFLQELLSAIKRKALKENNSEVLLFLNEFFKYSYGGDQGGSREYLIEPFKYSYDGNQGGSRENLKFDFEGGGLGIIYTVINLGENRE